MDTHHTRQSHSVHYGPLRTHSYRTHTFRHPRHISDLGAVLNDLNVRSQLFKPAHTHTHTNLNISILYSGETAACYNTASYSTTHDHRDKPQYIVHTWG